MRETAGCGNVTELRIDVQKKGPQRTFQRENRAIQGFDGMDAFSPFLVSGPHAPKKWAASSGASRQQKVTKFHNFQQCAFWRAHDRKSLTETKARPRIIIA
jgi:hypothetical protein